MSFDKPPERRNPPELRTFNSLRGLSLSSVYKNISNEPPSKISFFVYKESNNLDDYILHESLIRKLKPDVVFHESLRFPSKDDSVSVFISSLQPKYNLHAYPLNFTLVDFAKVMHSESLLKEFASLKDPEKDLLHYASMFPQERSLEGDVEQLIYGSTMFNSELFFRFLNIFEEDFMYSLVCTAQDLYKHIFVAIQDTHLQQGAYFRSLLDEGTYIYSDLSERKLSYTMLSEKDFSK